MSDMTVDPAGQSVAVSKPAGPNQIVIVILVSAAAICLCGVCLFVVGAPAGDAAGLALKCTIRSISDDAVQECTDWAVNIVLNHADALDECEANQDSYSRGAPDDAIVICLEEQGLGLRP